MPNVEISWIQLTWPEMSSSTSPPSGLVDTEQWWSSLEYRAIEGATYKEVEMEPILGTEIAPWIPPACRSRLQYNTQHQKESSGGLQLVGCPKQLAECIRREEYNPLTVHQLPNEKLHNLCRMCNVKGEQGLTKVYTNTRT